MIVLNKRKYAAQVSDYPRLSAVMDVTVPDDMRSDRIPAPPVKLGDQRAVPLCLSTILVFIMHPFVVIILLFVFTE